MMKDRLGMRKVSFSTFKGTAKGYFHCWSLGIDYDVNLNRTMGIVETELGEVLSVKPYDITFIEISETVR